MSSYVHLFLCSFSISVPCVCAGRETGGLAADKVNDGPPRGYGARACVISKQCISRTWRRGISCRGEIEEQVRYPSVFIVSSVCGRETLEK
jgi:hypothetical protein